MERRQLLVMTAGAMTALAGCSSGDPGGSGGGDSGGSSGGDSGGTNGGDAGGGGGNPTGVVPGKLYKSPTFKGHDVAATANTDENTLTVSGTLENVGEADRVVTGMYLKFYDGGGEVLLTASSQLDSPVTIPTGGSGDVELTTDNLGHTTVTTVASFEAMVSSHTK